MEKKFPPVRQEVGGQVGQGGGRCAHRTGWSPGQGSPFNMKVSTRIHTPLTATTRSANRQAHKRENTDGCTNLQLSTVAPWRLSQQPPGDAPHTHGLDQCFHRSYINQWFHSEKQPQVSRSMLYVAVGIPVVSVNPTGHSTSV